LTVGARGRIVTGALGLILAGALVLGTVRAQEFRVRPYLYSNLYLPSGEFVQQTSLGYRELAADLVWFQATQYFGGYAKNQHSLAYFKGLIDIVTDLDPNFVFPYVFGAIVMAQDMSDLQAGVDILRKGMWANPASCEFPFEIGFLHYIVRADEAVAARYFTLASRLPGGGDRARRFAAFVASKAGHVETSIRMWEELAATSKEPYMRDMARRYIERLRTTGRIQKVTHDG
jgi:hypothetical protein